MRIRSWRSFEKHVRDKKPLLLSELHNYQGSVLVAGCQRSGTTAVAEMIGKSEVFGDYSITKDKELDAALILSGCSQINSGRYCFQTTYLNENYFEYFAASNCSLIWVVREPQAVVRSMLKNWSRGALKRLYKGVGNSYLKEVGGSRETFWSKDYVDRLQMACSSYIGKINQTKNIVEKTLGLKVIVIRYQDLITNDNNCIENLYKNLELDFHSSYANILNGNVSGKRGMKLPSSSVAFVKKYCSQSYENSLKYLTEFEF